MQDVQPIKIFIGYDHVEAVAYHVLAHSLMKFVDRPIQICPISLHHLKNWYDRPRDPKQSNDFSFSRWLVPWLCGYKGFAIYLDCDMLAMGNVAELWDLKSAEHVVQVVQQTHADYGQTSKFLGRGQLYYKKKNWSSMVIFNNEKCRILTPKFVSRANGLDLHQFKWIGDDNQIGSLPAEWNHLVGVHTNIPNVKLAHYTLGGPWFKETKNCPYSDEWRLMYEDMLHCNQ